MRNRLLKAFVVGSLLIILLGMPLLFESHRIRPSSARRIKAGMAIAEVVELLGAQPGCYDGYDPSSYGNFGRYHLAPGTAVWCSRHCWIVVMCDKRGSVLNWTVGRSEPATWLAKLWHRLAPPSV